MIGDREGLELPASYFTRGGRARVLRKYLRASGFVLAAFLAVVGVLLSPLALTLLARIDSVDWSRLSDVGQTYGGASAVLAALALAGVSISLAFQARQNRGQQMQGVRQFHINLMRLALEEPELYLPCWDPLVIPSKKGEYPPFDRDQERRLVYTNLIFNYQWLGFETGGVSEPELRRMISEMFLGDIARNFWELARGAWRLQTGESRRGRRFFEIIDSEFRRPRVANEQLVAESDQDDSHEVARTSESVVPGISIASAAFGGGVLATLVVRKVIRTLRGSRA